MFWLQKEPTYKMIQMKRKILLKIGLVLIALTSPLITKAQIQQTTVQGTPVYEYNYSFQNLQPSQAGAFFSYLWWFGDNGFTFVPSPNYIHNYNYGGTSCSMMAVVTENYGTGGPPPAPHVVQPVAVNGNPSAVLHHGNGIYLQHFRNAVPNDTMYLILTYTNIVSPSPVSGFVEFDIDPNLQLLTSMFGTFPQMLPNGEQLQQGLTSFKFSNLKQNEERSILVPVRVLAAANENVGVKADLLIDGQNNNEGFVKGYNTYSIQPDVVTSHDPNVMIEQSDAASQCDYSGQPIDYTVKFQNSGEGPTRYVKVTCFLDDKVDLNTITDVTFPPIFQGSQIMQGNLKGIDNAQNEAIWKIDHTNKTLTFEMHDLILRSTNDSSCQDLETTRAEVAFKINVKSNYIFGDPVVAYSEIIFDENDIIATDSVFTVCMDPLPMDDGGGFQTENDVRKELRAPRDRQIQH